MAEPDLLAGSDCRDHDRWICLISTHTRMRPDTSSYTQAQKQALAVSIYRDYWDPTYVSPSGTINQAWTTQIQPDKTIPFRIPRMRAIVNIDLSRDAACDDGMERSVCGRTGFLDGSGRCGRVRDCWGANGYRWHRDGLRLVDQSELPGAESCSPIMTERITGSARRRFRRRTMAIRICSAAMRRLMLRAMG